MKLNPDSFAKFHEDVHGYAPFAWQQRLLEQVMEKHEWPEVLDLPTGAGKTTCIDIALFALALNAREKELWCPRRIAMVVDRRVVVDQVAERGRKLAARLRTSDRPVLKEVALRLASLSCTEDPLGVFTLRGGMPKDDGWARSPDQPLIIASTVDQLGSRLLMQGYGVSPSMAPVHAGLLANDTLVLLDEVHLSVPFAETLKQLSELRKPFAKTGLQPRFHLAFLSATPIIESARKPFRLTKSEMDAKDLLGQRLSASKKARLIDAADRAGVEKACVDETTALLSTHRTLAVVLNRVNSAAIVARQLQDSLGEDADVRLLTGRMRPLDRDDVLRGLRDRIEAGRKRADDSRKLVVVATQCIEAGADFDFDALVTEAASLAALRQRFGRIDRLGQYRKAEGVIVRDKSAQEDPVYGEALNATWKWLESLRDAGKKKTAKKKRKKGEEPTVDFGVLALPTPEAGTTEEEPKRAPVLLPVYLDLWSQTNPAPAIIPDVALFLHGPETGPADVQVVWRADVTDEHFTPKRRDELIALVTSVRPSSLEALSLPFVAAKKWLAATRGSEDVFDVEGSAASRDDSAWGGSALRWRGDDSDLVSAADLRPGDTFIVPSNRGGLRDGCFDANATEVVTDLAERAALFGRGQAVLRLHAAVLGGLGLGSLVGHLSEDLDVASLSEAMRGLKGEEDGWRRIWIEHLIAKLRRVPVHATGSFGLLLGKPLSRKALHALARSAERDTIEQGVEVTTDDKDSVFAGRSVPLREHSEAVQRHAREFAERLRFPEGVQSDLGVSGWLHDIGKTDRRFQVLLREGDEVEFLKDEEPWAKSGMPSAARDAQRRARQLSGYPRGARHEVQSLAMLVNERNSAQLKANDLELVLHLVASHHGHCRPFAPAVDDPKPLDLSLHGFDGWNFEATSTANGLHRLDSEIPTRFWNLQRRLGWFELCWLEAVLRLADHRASEEEQRKEDA